MSAQIQEIIERMENKGTIQAERDAETLSREVDYMIERMETIMDYSMYQSRDFNQHINPERAKQINRAQWMLGPDCNPIITFISRNKAKIR